MFFIVVGVDVCPGESVGLSCTVNDTSDGFGTTVWRGDSSVFDCASREITLRHTVAMDTADCGQTVGRIVAVDGNNFTSVLTVIAPDVSGSLLPVQCTFPQAIPDPPIVVMEYNVTVTGEFSLDTSACRCSGFVHGTNVRVATFRGFKISWYL